MKTRFKGSFVLDGKIYKCEVINGIRYVEGKTVRQFFETLTDEQKRRFAVVGKLALKDERLGVKPPKNKYQYYLNP